MSGHGRVRVSFSAVRPAVLSDVYKRQGYGLTYNWNLLGDGVHTLRVLADGVEFGRVSFRVTTLGATYLQGISGEYSLPDFPQPGDQVAVRWSEPHQNFVIFGANPNRGTTHSSGVPHNNRCV